MSELRQRLDDAVEALNILMICHHSELNENLAYELTEADITINGIRDALFPDDDDDNDGDPYAGQNIPEGK